MSSGFGEIFLNFILENDYKQYVKGDRSWSPLSLCLFCLFLFGCDFRFHRFYKLSELFLAFLSCLGIYVLGDAFAIHSRREPPLVEVVIYHSDANLCRACESCPCTAQISPLWWFAPSFAHMPWVALVRAFRRLYRLFFGRCEPPLAVAWCL